MNYHPYKNLKSSSPNSIYHSVSNHQYGYVNYKDWYYLSKSSKEFIQRLEKISVLDGHSGCVNSIAWNDHGSLLLSGSDDYHLNIYDPYKCNLLHSLETGHRANIFSAKFLPCTSDMKVVSCSGDGMLNFSELHSGDAPNCFNCHSGTAYEVVVTPGDPNTFLSCGEDGTVRLFDLRVKSKCDCQECSDDILIDIRHAVTCVSVNPMRPYELAAGCKDKYVRVFDRRTLGTSLATRSVNRNRNWMPGLFCKFKPENMHKEFSCRVTSVAYSNDGEDLLVSYCSDYVYNFTVKDNTGTVLDLSNEHSKKSDQSNATGYINGREDLPPVKKLRLRGDWSDTGPQARPESEEDYSAERNLMQRMSDLFSRWFEEAVTASNQRASPSTDSNQSHENNLQESNNVGLNIENRDSLEIGSFSSNQESTEYGLDNSQTDENILTNNDFNNVNNSSSTENHFNNDALNENNQDASTSGSNDSTTTRDEAASRIQRFLRSRRQSWRSNGVNEEDHNEYNTRHGKYVYLPNTSQVYKGHRNSRTMIKEANYWGEDYILSGSDCGRIFVWNKKTSECVMMLEGDKHVVNCVQPHPFDPILATSGIDHDIKLWAPISPHIADLSDMQKIIERNEQMLEETRDTITVPASFALRMFARFGHMRDLLGMPRPHHQQQLRRSQNFNQNANQNVDEDEDEDDDDDDDGGGDDSNNNDNDDEDDNGSNSDNDHDARSEHTDNETFES